jgi:hypothetical protein
MLLADTSATKQLGEFAAGLGYDDLPPDVVTRLKDCVLDALGCCLYGVTLPWTRMLIDLVAEEGGNPIARVVGTPLRTGVSQAVLIGATAGHGFEIPVCRRSSSRNINSLPPFCSPKRRSGPVLFASSGIMSLSNARENLPPSSVIRIQPLTVSDSAPLS